MLTLKFMQYDDNTQSYIELERKQKKSIIWNAVLKKKKGGFGLGSSFLFFFTLIHCWFAYFYNVQGGLFAHLTILYCLINLPSYTFNLLESRCTVITAKDLELKELEHNAIKFSAQYTAGYDKMMLSDPRYQRIICFLTLPCQFSY